MADKKIGEKKHNIFSRVFIDFAMLVISLFKFIPNLVYLVETEAKMAGRGIVSLLVLYLIAGTLLTSIWICLLTMCLVYFVSLHLSWLLSLFIIVVVNVLLLVIIALVVSRTTNKLSFARTRKLLRNVSKS